MNIRQWDLFHMPCHIENVADNLDIKKVIIVEHQIST